MINGIKQKPDAKVKNASNASEATCQPYAIGSEPQCIGIFSPQIGK